PGGHRRIDLDEFQRFLAAQGRPPYPVGAGTRTRLLVVDDEPLVVAMLVDLLSEGPFTIETATDGYEALVKVGTFRPAVIVLDAVMPGLDWIEACRGLPLPASPSRNARHSQPRRDGASVGDSGAPGRRGRCMRPQATGSDRRRARARASRCADPTPLPHGLRTPWTPSACSMWKTTS